MWKYLLAILVLGKAICASTCTAIEGSQITAKDVSQIDPAFASVAPDLLLSWAPAIGKQRVIPASEIAAWAIKAGVQSSISVPACFERSAHKLEAAEIAEAISAAFPKSKTPQIEVLEICNCRVPPGRLQFTAEGASTAWAGHPETPVLWMGQLISQSGSAYPVWARVRVNAPAPDIPRGSTVTVEVVNGSTRLELKARAETAANIGDTVILTNPSGLRRFRATVTGPGLAQITLSKEKDADASATTLRGTL